MLLKVPVDANRRRRIGAQLGVVVHALQPPLLVGALTRAHGRRAAALREALVVELGGALAVAEALFEARVGRAAARVRDELV